MLSAHEEQYYNRQIILTELGKVGQERLKNARVLVIGAGGLGCPVLLYLAAAGVGHIGIVDHDEVSISNLHRQILYSHVHIGRPKAEVAAEVLMAHNQNIDVEFFNEKLNSSNINNLFSQYDIIADGTDNFPTRYLINDACVRLGKVNVFASISEYKGNVAVFNMEGSCHYRDIFPSAPTGHIPNCEENGVIGVLPGIIGTMQAAEIIKVITGIGTPLVNKWLTYNMLDNSQSILSISKNYNDDALFQNEIMEDDLDIKEINAQELHHLIASEEADFLLFDIREANEHQAYNIGGTLLPPSEVMANKALFLTDKKVVLYCKTGVRSAYAIDILQKELKTDNLYNLQGGIDNFARFFEVI